MEIPWRIINPNIPRSRQKIKHGDTIPGLLLSWNSRTTFGRDIKYSEVQFFINNKWRKANINKIIENKTYLNTSNDINDIKQLLY